MKFLYLRAVALVLILFAYFPNYASVVQSADIRYECVGTNSYKVILTVSQDATGVGLAANQQIRYESLACGIDALLDLQANGPVQSNNPSETCPQAGAVSFRNYSIRRALKTFLLVTWERIGF